MGHGIVGAWPVGSASLLFLCLAALGLLLAALVLSSSRRREPAQEEAEGAVYDNMDGQISSMLLQAGGPLTQDAIRDNLGVPVAAVARTLEAMEKRGDVRRHWLPREYTYVVHRAVASSGPSPSAT